MTLLIIGLVVFFGIHLLPSFSGLRTRLVERFEEGPYKGIFSLIAMAGLVLIVIGMGDRDIIDIWEPPIYTSHLALLLMVPVFVLLAAAYIPSNIKRFIRHPMLLGVIFWSAAHLLANGDLGSILLFGSFLAFSLFDIWSANRRGAQKSKTVRPVIYDVAILGLGIILYLGFVFLHPHLIGVPVITM